MRLSQEKSETTGQCFPLELLCDLLGVPRSSFYEHRRRWRAEAGGAVVPGKKPGPKPHVDDQELLQAIVTVILETPFITEGVKKVYARLRYRGIKAARHRVNRLMRENGLLSPQRAAKTEENTHDGTIIPETINQLWGTDATMFGIETGELLWLFAVIDHYSDELLGWHIVEMGQGNRFAALEPIKQALRKIRGAVGKDVGGQIGIRHDWGPQYIAGDFKKELEFLGLKNSPALMHQPQTNGIIERFFKTLKLECLWVQRFRDVQHAREVVAGWMELYNTHWLIERHGYRTPRQVRQACQESQLVSA